MVTPATAAPMAGRKRELARGAPMLPAGTVVTGTGMGLLVPTANSWLPPPPRRRSGGRALGGVTSAMFLGVFASPLLTTIALARMRAAGV